jgi:hypothetical protein
MTEFVKVIDGVPTQSIEADVKPDDIPHKNVIWLPLEVVKPEFDPITHVQMPPIVDIQKGKVVATFGIRAKTADEMDRDSAAQIGVDIASLRIHLNHENRIRTLEGKAPIALTQFISSLRTTAF